MNVCVSPFSHCCDQISHRKCCATVSSGLKHFPLVRGGRLLRLRSKGNLKGTESQQSF